MNAWPCKLHNDLFHTAVRERIGRDIAINESQRFIAYIKLETAQLFQKIDILIWKIKNTCNRAIAINEKFRKEIQFPANFASRTGTGALSRTPTGTGSSCVSTWFQVTSQWWLNMENYNSCSNQNSSKFQLNECNYYSCVSRHHVLIAAILRIWEFQTFNESC